VRIGLRIIAWLEHEHGLNMLFKIGSSSEVYLIGTHANLNRQLCPVKTCNKRISSKCFIVIELNHIYRIELPAKLLSYEVMKAASINHC